MSRFPLIFKAQLFGPQVCGDLAAGASREWIVADGCGGYAMGTVSGLRTRRYHALLVAAGDHPGARQVALTSLDPVVEINGTSVSLGVHEWTSSAISPNGYEFLESFTLRGGLPSWRWRIGETVIERSLAMVHGRSAIGVVHRLLAGPPVTLTLNAAGTWRDAHGERHASGPAPTMETVADGIVVDGAYRLAGPDFVADGSWWLGAHLREEAARGLAADEDLWSIGRFSATLTVGESLQVTAWVGDLDRPPPPAREIIAAEIARRQDLLTTAGVRDDVDATFALAADAFVIKGPDVVAGYPWFGAWSRDTMTSYEGLFLTSNRADLGRDLLLRYAGAVSDGMLPNTADTSAPGAIDFHSVDAPLWFIHAAGRHVATTGDVDLAAQLFPVLSTIIDAYADGTRFGIGTDARGLITAGTPDTSLTWMDARVDGKPVTSRSGSPVEINALWINALGVMASFGHPSVGHPSFETRRDAAVAAFEAAFTLADGSLPDVLTDAGADLSIRPNQLLAYSLPYGPMHGQPIGDALGAHLLTPLGMRTLAPDSPNYRGLHLGDGRTRDLAYHQGTVWPWMIGPYVTARHAAGQPTDGLLDGLIAHLGDYGLGSISETACGDAPHVATGCPYQAWSVAQTWTAYRLLIGSESIVDAPSPERSENRQDRGLSPKIDGRAGYVADMDSITGGDSSIDVRDVTTDEDYEAWRQVRIAVVPAERCDTVEEMRRDATPTRKLLLAYRDGILVGSGWANHSETSGGGSIAPRVLPEFRRQGIGSAILRALAEHITALGLPVIRSSVDDAESLAFAERFGFVEVDRQIEQVRTIGVEPAPTDLPGGVEVVTLDERPELWAECFERFGQEALADFATNSPMQVSADQWNTYWAGDPMFLALADGQVIGCAGVDVDTDRPARGENALTAVRRDWRGRGIAIHLKQATLHWAAANGLSEVYTWTQRGNESMRRLNERLGYVNGQVSITVSRDMPLDPS